jgi:hypothetical protein
MRRWAREISEAELRSQISSQAIVREKELCQAVFYIGLQHLVSGDVSGFHSAMREVLNFAPASLVKPEFYLAKWETER